MNKAVATGGGIGRRRLKWCRRRDRLSLRWGNDPTADEDTVLRGANPRPVAEGDKKMNKDMATGGVLAKTLMANTLTTGDE